MKKSLDLNSIIHGFSMAKYSTWLYYKPDNALFDCGEGVSTRFGNSGFGIDKIFLTHGHNDHIAGLSGLIWSRASSMGDKKKPLTIYYPAADPEIIAYKNYLASVQRRLPFNLRWIPLVPADNFEISAGRSIKTFQTYHIRGQVSLGYKVCEPRKRLKPEYAQFADSPDKIRELIAQKIDVSETYTATLLTVGGDGAPLESEALGSEILIHEATIIDSGDKKGTAHSTLAEAIKTAHFANPKALVLYHISSRYNWRQIKTQILQQANFYDLNFPIWVLYENQLNQIF